MKQNLVCLLPAACSYFSLLFMHCYSSSAGMVDMHFVFLKAENLPP
jgi:hypothetical protein